MKNAKIVIIGAGISGTAIAYNLAAKGVKNIVVIDKGYLTNGATGRCGAGVRQQWGTEANCLMAKKSIEFFEHAKHILAYDGDIEFKQEGYLDIGDYAEEEHDFDQNVNLQNTIRHSCATRNARRSVANRSPFESRRVLIGNVLSNRRSFESF
ncbi:MAG: FAD-binding oxidoreductase [Bacillus subtilis]|nr:FAD-binding oxidoreductase [Bacillus subtilis]